MLKWLIRILGGLLAVLVLAILACLGLYQRWLLGHERELRNESAIVQTARGPVEFAEIGKGRAVLVSHGTPGGYDGELAVLRLTHAQDKGFRYIVPSRPGYLRTPIDVGRTPQEQAVRIT